MLVNSSKQYLQIATGNTGIATIANFTPSTYVSAYTYTLDQFYSTAAKTWTVYIPNDAYHDGVTPGNVMPSSRILVSINQPLTYFINSASTIGFPTLTDVTDDNYYILNDKIEFDFGSNSLNRLNLNLTGVDFFGLPILVQAQYLFFYGSTYGPNVCASTGMPSGTSLLSVFNQYQTAMTYLPSTFAGYWSPLLATYTNPAGGGGVCKLRIYSPGTAMGSTWSQTNPSTVTFPTNYFLNTIGNGAPCTWYNAVWSGTTQSGATAFYEQNSKPYLILDATAGVPGQPAVPAVAKGTLQSDGSFLFTIQGGGKGVDNTTIQFPNPTSSMAFFTGAPTDYKPAIVSNAPPATVKQVLKVFATSIIGGFFPIDCRNPAITINQTYLENNSSQYFLNNALLEQALTGCACESNIPWYDYYSRTFLTIGTPNVFYTSAYSDFLGTDGTIVIVNPYTDNTAATVTISLDDLSGITLPDPYSDIVSYSITLSIPMYKDSGGHLQPAVTVQYSTDGGSSYTTYTSGSFPSAGNKLFLKVKYVDPTSLYYNSTFTTQIAPLQQLYHPTLPLSGTITTSGGQTTISPGG